MAAYYPVRDIAHDESRVTRGTDGCCARPSAANPIPAAPSAATGSKTGQQGEHQEKRRLCFHDNLLGRNGRFKSATAVAPVRMWRQLLTFAFDGETLAEEAVRESNK